MSLNGLYLFAAKQPEIIAEERFTVDNPDVWSETLVQSSDSVSVSKSPGTHPRFKTHVVSRPVPA
jgi:hypothetical protein